MSGGGAVAERRVDDANVVLIGYRGCGKSTIGQLLAEHLGRPFHDCDAEIEQRTQQSIREIFAEQGEPVFRAVESDVLRELLQASSQVISVGGGAVLSEENRKILRTGGVCVWLTAPPEELFRRMHADPRNAETRPALTVEGGLEEVRRLLAERSPLYAAVAHHVVDTAGRTVRQALGAVLAVLSADS